MKTAAARAPSPFFMGVEQQHAADRGRPPDA